MHKDHVTHVVAAPLHQFVISASVDGVVKFWTKNATGIEFVKAFKAHTGPIKQLSISRDQDRLISLGSDSIKLFDVANFDLI